MNNQPTCKECGGVMDIKRRDEVKKIYRITFNKYTNALKDTIYNKSKDTYLNIKIIESAGPSPTTMLPPGQGGYLIPTYLENKILRGSFLTKEQDINFFREFGEGIRTLEFVGYLYEKY